MILIQSTDYEEMNNSEWNINRLQMNLSNPPAYTWNLNNVQAFCS